MIFCQNPKNHINHGIFYSILTLKCEHPNNQSPVNRKNPIDIFDLDDRICKGHTVQCKKLEKYLCEFFFTSENRKEG